MAFYIDFSKAFHRVPHFELIKKIAVMRVGCMLKILSDYLEGWSQVVRVGNCHSTKKNITNGVSQGCILGPLLFCMFINDLSEALSFSGPFIFAFDLKTLAVNTTQLEIQTDLTDLDRWAAENKMSFAIDTCVKLQFFGKNKNLSLANSTLSSVKNIKNFEVIVTFDLT